MNVNFSELIYNKKCIFIGPSPYLIGKGHGKFFDSFDIIIRSNGAYPISKQIQKDYGSRCDILYINVSYAKIMSPLPYEKYKEAGIKYVCFKRLETIYKNDFIPIRGMYRDNIDIGTAKLMGLFLISDVLQYKPESLYLTGMDFYAGAFEYFNGYQPKQILDLAENNPAGKTYHDISCNINEFIRILKLNSSHIKLDHTLKEIVKNHVNNCPT